MHVLRSFRVLHVRQQHLYATGVGTHPGNGPHRPEASRVPSSITPIDSCHTPQPSKPLANSFCPRHLEQTWYLTLHQYYVCFRRERLWKSCRTSAILHQTLWWQFFLAYVCSAGVPPRLDRGHLSCRPVGLSVVITLNTEVHMIRAIVYTINGSPTYFLFWDLWTSPQTIILSYARRLPPMNMGHRQRSDRIYIQA